MKLLPEINEALCFQCSHELLNMQKYKVIASYFEDLRLTNLAKRFYSQADEEYSHYSKIIDYLNTRLGGKFIPVEVETPNLSIGNPKDVGRIYLETEIGTTESLEEIAGLVYDSKSFMDVDFIQDMLKTQVTEEDEADEFNKKVNLVTDFVLFDVTFE